MDTQRWSKNIPTLPIDILTLASKRWWPILFCLCICSIMCGFDRKSWTCMTFLTFSWQKKSALLKSERREQDPETSTKFAQRHKGTKAPLRERPNKNISDMEIRELEVGVIHAECILQFLCCYGHFRVYCDDCTKFQQGKICCPTALPRQPQGPQQSKVHLAQTNNLVPWRRTSLLDNHRAANLTAPLYIGTWGKLIRPLP